MSDVPAPQVWPGPSLRFISAMESVFFLDSRIYRTMRPSRCEDLPDDRDEKVLTEKLIAFYTQY